MEIIVTNFFDKKFKKECKDFTILDLLNKINIESKNFITFKEPFFKLKLRGVNKTCRLILNYEKKYEKIILIDIFDKKDKKIGENITRLLHKDLILKSYELNLDDIEQGFYKIY